MTYGDARGTCMESFDPLDAAWAVASSVLVLVRVGICELGIGEWSDMYSELHCKTNYSFLLGASHADELVKTAVQLGYTALAITDENSLAGVVRALAATRETNLKLIVGAEMVPHDAPPVVLWAMDRQGYGNLSKLITVGRRRAPKGECWLKFDDIATFSAGLLAGVMPMLTGARSPIAAIDEQHPSYEWFHLRGRLDNAYLSEASQQACLLPGKAYSQQQLCAMQRYADLFGDRGYLLAELYRGAKDDWYLEQLQELERQSGLPLLVAGDVLYHSPARLPLHDVLTAIRHRTTVSAATEYLQPNADRHLQTIAARYEQFSMIPQAVRRTEEIAQRCSFQLEQLRYEYPKEFSYLFTGSEIGLDVEGVHPRYCPDGIRSSTT